MRGSEVERGDMGRSDMLKVRSLRASESLQNDKSRGSVHRSASYPTERSKEVLFDNLLLWAGRFKFFQMVKGGAEVSPESGANALNSKPSTKHRSTSGGN